MGDSKVIIDWALEKHMIHVIDLKHWMNRVKALKAQFRVLQFQHIYREFNIEADVLSKRAMGIGTCMIFWEQYMGDSPMSSGTLDFY